MRVRLLALSPLLAAALLVGGRSAARFQVPGPTDKPRFPQLVDSVPRALLVRYGQSLHYDTLPMARDVRYTSTVVNGRPAFGRVVVEPELGAYRLDSLALDSGRIVARLRVIGTPFNLPAGVTYIWVDRRHGQRRAYYVSENANVALWYRALVIMPVNTHTLNRTVRTQAYSSATIKDYSMDVTADQTLRMATLDTTKTCYSCVTWGWCQSQLSQMAAIR